MAEHLPVKNEAWLRQTPGLVTASVVSSNPPETVSWLERGSVSCKSWVPRGSMLHCEVQATVCTAARPPPQKIKENKNFELRSRKFTALDASATSAVPEVKLEEQSGSRSQTNT